MKAFLLVVSKVFNFKQIFLIIQLVIRDKNNYKSFWRITFVKEVYADQTIIWKFL